MGCLSKNQSNLIRLRTPIKVSALLRTSIKTVWAWLLITMVLISGCKTNEDIIGVEKPKSGIVPDEFGPRLIALQQKIDTVTISLQQAEGLAKTKNPRQAFLHVTGGLHLHDLP